eukprot:1396844-Amphidinium_carterae.2
MVWDRQHPRLNPQPGHQSLSETACCCFTPDCLRAAALLRLSVSSAMRAASSARSSTTRLCYKHQTQAGAPPDPQQRDCVTSTRHKL